jgi:hypothetical protein
VKSKEFAFKIVDDNNKWLNYVFANLGKFSQQLTTASAAKK